MLRSNAFLAFIIFLFIGVIFFNKSVFQGQVPFPGDLLIGHYNPYNSYSFMGYAPGSFPHKAQNIDVIEQLYPWKHFSIESLKELEFPLWNPYNFSGTPHLAAIQSGTFYPFNLLFLLLPFNLGWTIYIISQPVLAGIFTYFFLRELRLSFKSSILGGLAFSFSSFLVVWMQYGNIIHAVLWLPLILWLGIKNLKKPSLVKSVLISLFLAFSVLAGHFQVSIYLYGFSFIFLVFMTAKFYRERFFMNMLTLAGIYIFSLLISSVQLIPSIEIFLNSSRTDYTYERLVEFLIPTYHSISMLFPDFFGNPVSRNYWPAGTYIERATYFGIVPLFFALYAIISRKSSVVWFFVLSILAVFIIAFDSFITRFIYSIYIPPIIATSVPTRIVFVLIFSGSVLAAFGYNEIEKAKKFKHLLLTIIVFSAIVISTWFFVIVAPQLFQGAQWTIYMPTALRNLFIPTLAFSLVIFLLMLFILKEKRPLKKYANFIKRYLFAVILLATIFELYFFFSKFSPFSPGEFIYPQTSVFNFIKQNQDIYRSWGYGASSIPVNIQTYEKIYSTDGYDPFYIRRYGELLSTTENGVVSESIKRANANLAPGYGEENLRDNLYRQKMMNILGVKYIIHKKPQDTFAHDQTFDDSIYNLVWNDKDLQIYENTQVLPRAFMVTDYIVLKDEKEIIKKLYDDSFDPSSQIILEKDPGFESSGMPLEYDLKISDYRANKIEISVESSTDALLFLSDSYFSGWKARVDGSETNIFRANYALRAIKVPKGEHAVVFSYEPDSFKLGSTVSSIAIGSAVILLIFSYYRKRSK